MMDVMNNRRSLIVALIAAPPFVVFAGWLNLRFYPQLPAWYVWGSVTIIIIVLEVLGIRALSKKKA